LTFYNSDLTKTNNMPQKKVILGSEEWCSFPELDIPTIKARVDSGAKHLRYTLLT
jgi:hypothetical protein